MPPQPVVPNTVINVAQLQGFREYLNDSMLSHQRSRQAASAEPQRAQHLAQYRAYRAALEAFDEMLADGVVITLVDPLSIDPAASAPEFDPASA